MESKSKIKVVDYNTIWVIQFESLRAILADCLGDDIIAIEHVGSTAIPGKMAEPNMKVRTVMKR